MEQRALKLGLSFSYGGAYAAYYYGVYEYLHETFDLAGVSYFAGVSAGCQVAYWLACGIPPSDAWNKWFLPTMRRGCARKTIFGSPYYPDLHETALRNLRLLYEPSMLDACNRSLYICATDLETMRAETHHTFANQGELFDSLFASQCVPFLFDTHVTIRGVRYVDGAILSHSTNYEPCEASWIHVNVFTWENMHVLGSLTSLSHLHSRSHHAHLKTRGYETARRRHGWLVLQGLPLKSTV